MGFGKTLLACPIQRDSKWTKIQNFTLLSLGRTWYSKSFWYKLISLVINLFGACVFPSIRMDLVIGFCCGWRGWSEKCSLYNGIWYWVLFGPENHDATCNRIRYLISQKSGVTYVTSVNLTWFFACKKTLTLDNVVILIKWGFDKNQLNYYYNIFFAKCFYELANR